MIESKLKLIGHPNFLKSVVFIILLNSIILGAKTYPYLMDNYGTILTFLDNLITVIFILEVSLYLYVRGITNCFTDPWFVFDFSIVMISAVPIFANLISFVFELNTIPDLSHFAALRAVRVLRILRLISMFPNLRKVILGLLNAIPGIGSIGTVLVIILYSSSLIATQLYGEAFPKLFGTLQNSIFSLFQIMTVEGWPDIARKVIDVYPNSWIFFVTYILISAFIVVNLFVAVIVDAVQQEDSATLEAEKLKYFKRIEKKIDLLRKDLDEKKRV